MNKENLENLWLQFVNRELGVFEYRLLSVESIPSFHIGYTNENRRCLILELPANYLFNITLPQSVGYIPITYFRPNNVLCVFLEDDYFNDLFDWLILSIYDRLSQTVEVHDSVVGFIRIYNEWITLFERINNQRLSDSVIQGLFGELFLLRELISQRPEEIDIFLESWKGPFDAEHDFVFEDKDLEVKTIILGKNSIRISSEYQLGTIENKGLELIVLKAEKSLGSSLKEVALDIRIQIFEYGGNYGVFLRALQQKGLDFINIENYDNLKYQIQSKTIYNCLSDDFPKITINNKPDAVIDVKYGITLTSVENFITNNINY
jgi:hypothetical protein